MNLVFLYPQYFFNGSPYVMPTATSGYSERNLVSGSRQLTFKQSTATTTLSLKTDVRSLRASERKPDYLYLAGLNLVTSHFSPTIDVKGSLDSATTSSVVTDTASAVTKGDLVGKNQEDYIFELPNADYRDYWQVLFTTAGAISFELRKVFLGQFFYFGVEPDAPAVFNLGMAAGRKSIRTFDLRWSHVSNEQTALFTEKILRHREYNPIVLYTRDWTGVLNGERVIHCEVDSYTIERAIHNQNKITLKFKEVI